MFMAALFTIDQNWKPDCTSLSEWVNKLWQSHTLKHSQQ